MAMQIPFDPSGLEPRVVQAFDDLITRLQAWFNGGTITQSGAITANQPACRYVLPSNQSVPNNTDTALLWTGPAQDIDAVMNSIQYDNGAQFGNGQAFVPSASQNIVSPPLPGMYLVVAGTTFSPNATGRRDLWLQQVDDSGGRFDLAGATSVHTNSGADVTNLQVSAVVMVSDPITRRPGIRVMVYQNSGGALDARSGFSATYVSMIKLS